MKRRQILITFHVIFSAIFDLSYAQSCIIEEYDQLGECKHMNNCPEVRDAFRHTQKKVQVCNNETQTICCPLINSESSRVKKSTASDQITFVDDESDEWDFLRQKSIDEGNNKECTVKKNGQLGECKHINTCPEVRNAFKQRKELPQVCNFDLRTVCCPIELTKTRLTTSNERISARKCKEFSDTQRFSTEIIQSSMLRKPPIRKNNTRCFHDTVPLIVGGEKTKVREFPHMALIGFGEGKEEDYKCGGSLIAEQWILSAAHCVSANGDPANFAKLGHVIRHKTTEYSYTYKIYERIKHPNYNFKFTDNDIALFKLEKPATLNDYVIPICLPDTDKSTTNSAITLGYGKTKTYEDESDELMKVVIEYMDPDECTKQFKDNMKFANNIFDKSKMICAGSTNKTSDSCHGDSGGPFQIYHDESIYCMHQIIGITAFGSSECGHIGVPAVYTKVYHYLDWIEENVWPEEN